MTATWLIVLFLSTLGSAQNQNPDSTHCLILSNHPGTCLYFLTNELYTFDEAANACWSRYHAIPFVPLNDVDQHELLIKFYFHAKNNNAYDGGIGLGILIDERNNYYREHLYRYIGKHTTPNLEMWNQLIFRNQLDKTHDSQHKYPVDYPLSVQKKSLTGYLRINGKTGKIEEVNFSKKSYFACYSPRYPKFNCKEGWYTDYLSRTCMVAHAFNRPVTRAIAKDYCKENGANLASIHNQREYDIFFSFIEVPNLTPYERQKLGLGKEYWFGLRHQNKLKSVIEGGLGTSSMDGFDERYKKVAYFMDGTAYTGFHKFHRVEPTSDANQQDFNGQTLTDNGWYRNWATNVGRSGALCQSVVDVSGSNI